ncbi:MAG: hypothetical protein J7M24_00470, partial [Candidatus Latescibacteria bacterium]|nr:hypothetical protein [Candidatus Latescibacterota bacterium]
IDLVVLSEVPWSVHNLLQRIGRGNRRESIIHAIAIAKTQEEKSVIKTMFDIATSGVLPLEPYQPDFSVTVQQIFSYLYQHTEGKTKNEIVELISQLCSEENVDIILSHLKNKEWIEYRTCRWFASTKLMNIGESGLIHSNIPDSANYIVKDVNSGKEIGKISGVFDEVFLLNRRIWKVVSVSGNIIRVKYFKGKALAPFFHRSKNTGAFFHLLPSELKASQSLI